jgi:hypothetical protein
MPKQKIKLGDEIQDVVSKAQGIAYGRVEYLDGMKMWIIQIPIGEDDVKPREHYAPESFCKRVGDGVYPNTKPPMGFVAREQD